MGKKIIFSTFFLLIPIFSIILLTAFKMISKNMDFWNAFESFLPIIVFYYVIISVFWVTNLEKIKSGT